MPATALTEGIRVTVQSAYSRANSDPTRCYWFYTYTVRVHNEGTQPARLLRRNWLILDAEGREQHVEGPGVVGEQPYLRPGESFEYTSACPLHTFFGSMRGHYLLQRDDRTLFEAEIPQFALIQPDAIH